MFKKTIFLGLISTLFLNPGLSLADGIVLPPVGYQIQETGQRAVIFYEEKTQVETLVVSMKYQGDASNFVWLIPVPAEPKIERGSEELFTNLANKTTNFYYAADMSSGSIESLGGTEEKQAVTIVQETTVDYYDVTVLQSSNKEALATWLNENGYYYPENKAYIFNEYINQGWYFVAFKIAPEYQSAKVAKELKNGTATPVQLTFTTEHPVFPLRISSVGAESAAEDKRVEMTVYVLAKNKQKVTNLDVNYAQKLKKDEIAEFGTLSNGENWITPQESKYFLTKFTGNLKYSEMTEDIFFKDADDNQKVGIAKTSDFSWLKLGKFVLWLLLFMGLTSLVVIVSPLGLIYIFLTKLRAQTKQRKWKIFSQIGQWIVFALTNLVLILFFIVVYLEEGKNILKDLADFWRSSNYMLGALVVGVISIASIVWVLMLVINIRQSKKQLD